MSVEISVIIPARNAQECIERQLSALSEQMDSERQEIVVCDNGSTDDTGKIVRKWSARFPYVRLISASERSGVSYSRNSGARAARGEKILFCDADDEVQPGWVSAMSQALDHADLVGGAIDISSTNPPELLVWPGPPTPGRLPVAMGHRPYAVGAAIGVHRRVFDELGGFDETYVGGTEEVDFAWRAQKIGRSIAFAPDAVVHYELRRTVRAAARQFFGYGRSYAQLASRFPEAIERKPTLREEARAIRSLALDVLRSGWAGRHAWVRRVAWYAGRVKGSKIYRVHPPL